MWPPRGQQSRAGSNRLQTRNFLKNLGLYLKDLCAFTYYSITRQYQTFLLIFPPPRPPHQNKNCKLYICAWNLDPVHLGASRIPCPTPSLPNMRANSCVASLELRMHEIKDKPHQCHINKEISRWNEKKKTHTPNQHTNS